MSSLVLESRRRLLLGLVSAAMIPGTGASAPKEHAVWTSNGGFPAWDRQIGLVFARDSQVAIAGGVGLAWTGVGVAPMATGLRGDVRKILRHFDGVRLDGAFASAYGSQELVDTVPRFVTAASEDEAAIRIWPSLVLHPQPDGEARLALICLVEAAVEGLPKFRWSCELESTAVLPWVGAGGWADASTLNDAVGEHAHHVLSVIAREIALRRRGAWVDPVDPTKLVHINMPYWPADVFWSYFVIGETDQMLHLAQAHRGLGHLFKRRYAWDKRLVAGIQRPSE